MKKLLSCVICIAMIVTMLIPAFALADTEKTNSASTKATKATVTVLLGDVTGDEKVNTGDAVAVLRHCVSLTVITDPVMLIAADVTRDGQINAGDAVAILRIIAFDQEPVVIETEDPRPTETPTETPTEMPTETPTEAPTEVPTETPTEVPTETPTETPTEVPTETPTVPPTVSPSVPPTVPPTVSPSVPPTVSPSVPPTSTPTPEDPDTNYFYGNTYRGVDMQLVYSESIVENARPMNVFKAASEKDTAIELEHTMLNGVTITRTFEKTGESYTYEGQEYVQVKETTNWANIPGVIIVEKNAGATYTNSIALSSLYTNNSSLMGSDFSRNMFVLIEDIDWNGELWRGIGGGGTYYTTMFYSYFDGMGYAVNKIKVRQTISGSSNSYLSTAGFFGKLNGGGVANLILPNADVRLENEQNSYSTVGIIAGQAYNARIINCHTSGFAENLTAPYGCGGILGYSQTLYDRDHQGYCTITGCTSTASLSNNRSATAGILGKCIGPYNVISECWHIGMMSSTSTNVGGIVGWVSDTSVNPRIENCWSSGKYLGVGRENDTSSVVCGLVGSNHGDVSNCYTTAYVFTTAANPIQGHPSINGVATNTYYLAGRYYVSGTSKINFDPVTDEFISIDFSGYLTTGYQTAYGGTRVTEISDLAAVANGTIGVWNTAGVYPELINVYGHPTDN